MYWFNNFMTFEKLKGRSGGLDIHRLQIHL